ncbi:hypothetical protein BGX27_006680 [Mortierella sp. AM989]|nr:hypothetical protein BGX27_006680 [Mortierella sp. AM989]
MVIGLPGFVLYFVSPFRFKRLDSGHWNHVNWLVLTIFLAQVNSVVLPLIQFYMRQRPKQRSDSSKGSGRPFASILRWDSPKATPGTPNVDLHSDASSFRSHAQSPPQFMSPQLQSRPLEACDSSLYERQSLAQQSVVEVGNKDDDGPSAPINRSVTKNGRTRGMKGFWTKYGKDSDGNIIPLSRMDPRAFEYALQDGEMLGELVKFSITVFSAENTKFLQEYDGLRKQVREYYRLAGYGSSRSPKHSHSASDTSGSIANALGGLAPGLDLSSKPSRKKLSNLVSLTSSVHSKLSSHGLAGTMEDSPKSSRHESRIESIAEWGEEIPRSDGDPGSSTGVSVYALYPMKSFGKHRQDMKGSLWRLSLHSSLRNSNSPYVSPYGPVQEEVDGEIHQIGSSSLVMSPSKLATGQYHQQKESLGDRTFQSDSTISTLDDVDESRHGFGENDSERSSFSWYGRGNTGSTISYHDVTPSEISSYHDTGSEVIQLPMGYFGDVGSLVDYHQTDDLDVSIAGEPLNNKQEDTSNANGALFPPTPISSEKTTSSSSSKDTDASSSPYYSISEPCPKFVPGHSTSYSLGSYPIGYMTTDRLREGLPPPMHQKQSSRLAHPVNRSPFHSPSSSVSATFSPRLPLQPQSHSPNSIRPMPPTLQRSSSARNVLTAKDFQQLQSEADSITSVTPTGTPNQVPFNDLPQARRPSPLQRSASSPKRSSSSHSWSQIRARPIPGASTLSEVYRMSKAKLANNNDGIDVSNINGKTLVPKALLPAYWEICQTFIMPNSVLELNLSEHHVTKVKDLFLTSKCYLEMYESIAKEVQELVYSNVWPRFIQSIQRQPQGFSGKFKRTWNTFFGKEPEDQGDAIFEGNSNRIAGWLHRSRVHDTEQSNRGATSPSSQDYLSQNVDAMELGSLHPMPVPTPLPPPPQASYIHGQYSYLGLEEDEGAFPGESQARTENSDMEQLDLGRFGVMQELDFTALQHIMIDPK